MYEGLARDGLYAALRTTRNTATAKPVNLFKEKSLYSGDFSVFICIYHFFVVILQRKIIRHESL